MYDPDDMTLDASFAANTEPPPHVRWARERREAGDAVTNSQSLFAVSEREAKEACALTCGMIAMIDDAVGEILVERSTGLDLSDDTVVIFTADHGDYLGDHRIMLKGPVHYQSLIRVPFLWKDTAGRGAPAGASETLAGTLDIARTVLDRARIAPYNGIQGKSLMPQIDGAADDADADILIEDDQQRTILGFDAAPRVRTLVTRALAHDALRPHRAGASSTTSRTTRPSWSICGTTPPPAPPRPNAWNASPASRWRWSIAARSRRTGLRRSLLPFPGGCAVKLPMSRFRSSLACSRAGARFLRPRLSHNSSCPEQVHCCPA